jgi:glutamate carboxypeptidase
METSLLYQPMDPLLDWCRREQRDLIALLKELVECESPSDSAPAVNRFVDLVASKLSGEASIRTFPGGRYGRNLRCDFRLPGPKRKAGGRVLAVGHSDTVWPVGTLAAMPWREKDGRLWGPGVFDMKAGIAFFVFAMRGLRELDRPAGAPVSLWLVSDEEVGSEVSRPLTEKEAKASAAVLVLEPSTGLEGKLKTARKGVGDYTVTIRGRAAHAGVDFSAGASAIVELARQIGKIAGFTELKKGLTVNPGVIRGGTRTNVVASEAAVEVDIRIARMRDYAGLERKFRSLKAFDKRCSVEVSGGLNRPPMERTTGVVELFRLAECLSKDLGVKLEESSTGGGSDGNFTAGLGIPTLDGLGGVGEGAHAPHESILVDRIADRTALLAKLVERLTAAKPRP